MVNNYLFQIFNVEYKNHVIVINIQQKAKGHVELKKFIHNQDVQNNHIKYGTK